MPRAIMLEPSDFVSYPVGGQTTFSRQLMEALGDDLALVGVSCDDAPVGQWIDRTFNGRVFKFFSVARVTPSAHRPLVPVRVTRFLQFRRHRKAIMSLGVLNAFTQAPETLLAVQSWGWRSKCFYFAATANIIKMSRYRWAERFAALYEAVLCRALRDVDVILAAADKQEIAAFVLRAKGVVQASKIIEFPTRVDTNVFRPHSKRSARALLGISDNAKVLVSCARINRRKGWELVFEAFQVFLKSYPDSHLIYVGDGEDRSVLEERIERKGLGGLVSVTGFKQQTEIALYNSAADTFVNGSYFEGWPIAQLEAIACGAVVVSTDVSGARDLIREGLNGFVVKDREPEAMAQAMVRAVDIPSPCSISLQVARTYSTSTLAMDFHKRWNSPWCDDDAFKPTAEPCENSY